LNIEKFLCALRDARPPDDSPFLYRVAFFDERARSQCDITGVVPAAMLAFMQQRQSSQKSERKSIRLLQKIAAELINMII
jgi:non-ribosomal peptide synthetase component E (peptide arylation enzyme)